MARSVLVFVFVSLVATLAPSAAYAQPLGTFKWQLQSYCNVLSLAVTQNAGVFTLDGFDDQCGATTRAPVTGLATPNPDGTIEFGLTIVATPGAAPVHVAAAISLATLGGTWRDSTGATGNLVPTPGAGTGGSPRPAASATIPSSFLLLPDGGFLAGGTLGQGSIPASGLGTRMMWHPRKAAFRAGHLTIPAWDEINIGEASAAFGRNTVAGGLNSAAFGEETQAVGLNSAAFGHNSRADGGHAVAFGYFTQSSNFATLATGRQTVASGAYAMAAGLSSVASGTASFATGNFAEAGGLTSFAAGTNVIASGNHTVVLGSAARSLVAGAFMFGDASNTSPFFAIDANSFNVRAAGGYRLYSNSALTTGVVLASGGSGWGVVSDVNMKENFRDLDADDVLSKIARMPVREWNYKTQAAAIRHVGPTAQDFHAAFGLGEDSLRINTIDADGIALAGVKALESRSREQHDTLTRDNDALRLVIDALRGELAELGERLGRLEAKQ